MKIARALAGILALAVLAAPACSGDEPASEGRTTTTIALDDLDVEGMDPLAAVDVEPSGADPAAVAVPAESVADLGGGRRAVTAFVRTCASVAEVRFDGDAASVLVVDPGCDGPNQLVRVVVPATAGTGS
jgi:hypothetical protein